MIKNVWIIVLCSSIILFLVNFFFRTGLVGDIIFWLLLPFLIAYFIGKDVGIKLPNKKYFLISIGLFFLGLAIAYYSFTINEIAIYYSHYSFDIIFIVTWIISLVCTEFFFRGFMLFGLENKFGKYSAIIQSIPYMFIHLGKPWPEFYFSFFAGIVFGIINMKSKSFLPSFMIHLSGLGIVYIANM